MNGRWIAEQRVAERDRGVGQASSIDDRDVEVAGVQPVDQGALVVRLEEPDFKTELVGASTRSPRGSRRAMPGRRSPAGGCRAG